MSSDLRTVAVYLCIAFEIIVCLPLFSKISPFSRRRFLKDTIRTQSALEVYNFLLILPYRVYAHASFSSNRQYCLYKFRG